MRMGKVGQDHLNLIEKIEAKLKPNFIEMVGNNGSNGKQGRVIGC
jgi:hypothetical protein